MNTLSTLLKSQQEELENLKQELHHAPPGHLIKRGNTYTYTHGKNSRTITKQPDLIQKLTRSRLAKSRIKQLEYNIQLLEKAQKSINFISHEQLINKLPTSYHKMPITHFFHPEVTRWMTQPFKKNTIRQEQLIYPAQSGQLLRSKSEREIANALEFYHIPYRYDGIIQLENHTYSPDFIIKNPFTNKTFIWEHFGSFHIPEYEQSMNNKMDRYHQHGYRLDDNLIATFEWQTRTPSHLHNIICNTIL